ncbi:hypothetical protein HDU91_002889, partial [Kappamyces sp. JEL0680]
IGILVYALTVGPDVLPIYTFRVTGYLALLVIYLKTERNARELATWLVRTASGKQISPTEVFGSVVQI